MRRRKRNARIMYQYKTFHLFHQRPGTTQYFCHTRRVKYGRCFITLVAIRMIQNIVTKIPYKSDCVLIYIDTLRSKWSIAYGDGISFCNLVYSREWRRVRFLVNICGLYYFSFFCRAKVLCNKSKTTI
jgi:hypothetical protein